MNAKGQQITSAAERTRTTLRNKVPMPSATSDQGNVGDYAVEDDTLAIYVEGRGWMFWTGYER